MDNTYIVMAEHNSLRVTSRPGLQNKKQSTW